MRVLVVGAGLAGAVCAQQFHKAGHDVHVIDSRPHVAGNCHTARDERTSVMEHVYGPHIFNTSLPHVWAYVKKFAEWTPYVNRVKAQTERGIFSLPINLHTINQFFNSSLTPTQAESFLQGLSNKKYANAQNFEERGRFLLGDELYETFFHHYTKKQWGCEPSALSASILSRLPVRFNYNDNYYNAKWQALPTQGYTEFVKNVLSGIKVELITSWDSSMKSKYDLVIFTGPIDSYFKYAYGRLGYRTVYWEKTYGRGDLQGCAVINDCTPNAKHTRSHEHKHFAPWEQHSDSIILTEYSKETTIEDIPFYPKRLSEDKAKLAKYEELAKQEGNVAFCGRLGTYSYMNMDQVIAQALELSKNILTTYAV